MSCPICRKPLVVRKRKISTVRSLPHEKRYQFCKNCGIGWIFQQVRFNASDGPMPLEAKLALLREKRDLERKLRRLDVRLAKN